MTQIKMLKQKNNIHVFLSPDRRDKYTTIYSLKDKEQGSFSALPLHIVIYLLLTAYKHTGPD